MDQNLDETVASRNNYGSQIELNTGAVTNNFITQAATSEGSVTLQHGTSIWTGNYDRAQECHRSFKTTDYEARKNTHRQRHPGTCEWVLKHPQFRRWRQNSGRSLLWLSADAGCGKSVLSRFLVDSDILAEGQASVCYFFFEDATEHNTLATALCAILHQLFSAQPYLLHHAMLQWQRNGIYGHREAATMWRILCAAAADPASKPITCVLDALDECREPDCRHFLDLLGRFYSQASVDGAPPSKLKLLVTSRPVDSIEHLFWSSSSADTCLQLYGEKENDQVCNDIRLVIKDYVKQLSTEFSLSYESRDRLRHDLLQIEHRSLLGLDLVLEQARMKYQDSLCPDDVRIERLPACVEDLYNKISGKLAGIPKKTTRTILLLVLAARQPLTVFDLSVALALLRSKPLDHAVLKADESHMERRIRRWCGHLVVISRSHVYLIHRTVKDFLMRPDNIDSHKHHDLAPNTWQHSISILDAHRKLAVVCEKACSASQDAHWQINPSYSLSKANSFVRYALRHGLYHKFEALQRMHNYQRVFFVHQIPGFGIDLQALDETGKSLLHYMTHAYHHSVNYEAIAFILDRGGLVQSADEDRFNCLQYAALRDDTCLLRMLLKAGFEVNKTEYIEVPPKGGRFRTRRNIDPLPLHHSPTALHTAASFGQAESVSFLLRSGANARLIDQDGRTALHRAVIGQHNPCFSASHGRLTHPYMLGYRPSSRMIEHIEQFAEIAGANKAKIVGALCNTSPSLVNVRDYHGWTPLHGVSCSNTSQRLTNCGTLLKYGADPRARDNQGITPIHIAAFYGDLDCLESLITTDDDYHIADNCGRTMLHFAAIGVYKNSVALEFGWLSSPSVGTAADCYEPALLRSSNFSSSFANYGGANIIAEFLLGNASLASCTDHCGQDALALHITNRNSCLDARLIATLLQNGSDSSFRDSEGRNLAHLCLSERSTSNLAVLLALKDGGVRISDLDRRGRSILHHLAMGDRLDTDSFYFHLRSCVGIDIDLRDVYGKTADDYACKLKPDHFERWNVATARFRTMPCIRPPCECRRASAMEDGVD